MINGRSCKKTFTYSGVVIAGLIGILLCAGEVSGAEKAPKEPPPKGTSVKPETVPPKAVTSAPACDPNLHPKVTGVVPDHIKSGMKIMIKGSGFGKKECFKDVSFGSTRLKDYKLVSDSTVEVTVPAGLKPGMMKVHIQTAGGTADDTVLLEKK